jgi:cytochrome c biogenesis protein CcmG/thiol:disulfide interchange protein DsbE
VTLNRFFLIAILLIAICLFFGCKSKSVETEAGKTAPDFRANDLTGKTYFLNAELGKPVVLVFFATWCAPCRSEAPLIGGLYNELAGAATILSIVIDPENIDQVRSFVNGLSIPYPMLLDEDGSIQKAYGISELPATLVIDKTGKIRSQFKGFNLRSLVQLKSIVNQLIKE